MCYKNPQEVSLKWELSKYIPFHVLKSYPLSGYLLYKESPITHSMGLVSLLTTRFILYFRCYDSLHDSVPIVPIVNCWRYRNNTITLHRLERSNYIMLLRVGCQWLAHITWLWDKEEVLLSFFCLMVWIPRTCMSGATAKALLSFRTKNAKQWEHNSTEYVNTTLYYIKCFW